MSNGEIPKLAGTMTVGASDPTEARKRRKEIIQSQRLDTDGNEASSSAAPGVAAAASTGATSDAVAVSRSDKSSTEKKPPKKRKIEENVSEKKVNADSTKKKTQIRYDPDVPMSKEQLAAWRREARRVRNRESAAASRQRIRNRITELEDEVGEWKDKYTQAMERLQNLEKIIGSGTDSSAKT